MLWAGLVVSLHFGFPTCEAGAVTAAASVCKRRPGHPAPVRTGSRNPLQRRVPEYGLLYFPIFRRRQPFLSLKKKHFAKILLPVAPSVAR